MILLAAVSVIPGSSINSASLAEFRSSGACWPRAQPSFTPWAAARASSAARSAASPSFLPADSISGFKRSAALAASSRVFSSRCRCSSSLAGPWGFQVQPLAPRASSTLNREAKDNFLMLLNMTLNMTPRFLYVAASNPQQPRKEGAVAAQGNAQVLGGDIITLAPLLLELLTFLGEYFRQTFHGRGDQTVGFFHRLPRFIHERHLHAVPLRVQIISFVRGEERGQLFFGFRPGRGGRCSCRRVRSQRRCRSSGHEHCAIAWFGTGWRLGNARFGSRLSRVHA